MDKSLLEKYLDNNCTPAERALVEAYLQLPESTAVLSELLEERLDKDMHADFYADKQQQQQWAAKMRTRMGRNGMVKPIRRWYYMVAAASILIIAGFLGLFNNRKPTPVPMASLVNKAGERKNLTLPDGSVIYLGASSQITYPEAFTGANREISIKGEAFFDIATDTKHPFIIHTGNVAVTVLGTSFKIAAFEGQAITVSVATGKVRVDDHTKGQLAILTAGKQISWDNKEATLADVNAGDIAAWHKGRLVFNNQTLEEIATTLERWYDVKINFSRPKKAKEKITVTLFASAGLNSNLQTLSVGNKFTYSIKGHEIIVH
jgi:ferric-dicitrate binding protein FerR (iron transport regulator)